MAAANDTKAATVATSRYADEIVSDEEEVTEDGKPKPRVSANGRYVLIDKNDRICSERGVTDETLPREV